MICNKFLLLNVFGSIGLTGLSEISFSTMAWRLGIRGEKIEEKRRWRWVMAQQIYQAEKIYSFHCIVNIYRKLKKK